MSLSLLEIYPVYKDGRVVFNECYRLFLDESTLLFMCECGFPAPVCSHILHFSVAHPVFMDNLQAQRLRRTAKDLAAKVSPYWPESLSEKAISEAWKVKIPKEGLKEEILYFKDKHKGLSDGTT